MKAVHRKAFAETIGYLAVRWNGAKPLLPAFGLLARGEPLRIAQLADVAGTSVEEIEERLNAVRCERDESRRIIDLFGMTLSRTPIAIEIGENVAYACCALWAVIIPKLVKRTVVVRSVDPLSNEPVQLIVRPDGIDSVEPSSVVATLAVASANAIAADVRAAFCSHVRFFHSRDNAERFAQASPNRHVAELEELHEAAQGLFGAIFDCATSLPTRSL